MDHMSLDLVKVIQEERIGEARRARLGGAAQRRRRGTLERFSMRGALGGRSQASTEPLSVACPIPSS